MIADDATLAHFIRLAGGSHAAIAVTGPLGSGSESATENAYLLAFERLGALAERLYEEGASAHLLRATGLWLTHGTVQGLVEAMPDDIADMIVHRSDEGLVIGGPDT
ncbi:MAG: hypothetical protein Q7V88_09120 [Actinomycetota bacterium]|nr:hypothetical protein [Actinomycetota bacterium]